ncbi:type II toxin-antitoxin system RelE/ParE family toxin [Bremerella cremea]|uniref:Type II toxin-antitoxin system RelE/ParE family toxin n=1 Tax=Bremerella cremea TaxID=1031537 RepID=A0A368KTE0_9BACT|nr:type II toxin-antitoxin system RelE/ParE family toxin [Bremerella cremea]RCS49209.1 type II toxin-antitoxin system RelE/ParE family toxin [Bremerella cremea]
MSRSGKVDLEFTLRAISDLEGIVNFSLTQFGKKATDKYLDSLNAAFDRIQSHPNLLCAEPSFHPDFCFYRANKHLIVCDASPKTIFVLTILSTSMDLPARLAELQPSLEREVEALHTRLRKPRGGKQK